MKKNALVLVLVLVLTAGTANAHYTFVMPEKFRIAQGDTIRIGFHSADGFPDSTAVGKRLTNATLHAATGPIAINGLTEDGKRLVGSVTVPASGHIVATVVNATGMETMKPDSFTKYLEEEGLTNIVEERAKSGESDKPARERYTMYGKSILLSGSPDEGYRRPAGLPMEFIPEKDPFAAKTGELLPVRVLFKGMPAKGLDVMATTTGTTPVKAQSIGRTDAEGRINVPVKAGLWRLHTILMERSSQADADWESYWATLTFEIR